MTKLLERVFSETIVYFPIPTAVKPAFDMVSVEDLNDLTREQREFVTTSAFRLATESSMNYPFNPIEQKPIFIMTVATQETEDWLGLEDDEEFRKALEGAISELTLDFGVYYSDAIQTVSDMIEAGSLDGSIDYFCVFYMVFYVEEGKKKSEAERIESKISVFAGQGRIRTRKD